jgi:hypothetical protein
MVMLWEPQRKVTDGCVGWAKQKARPKRTISAAGRRRIDDSATRTLGQGQSTVEESCLRRTLGSIQAVKITLEEALALLGKYAEERTSVLAVVGSSSALSVARVTGPIRVFIADGVPPHLTVGKEDDTSDQIKFRLSDCMFEYDEFREADCRGFR